MGKQYFLDTEKFSEPVIKTDPDTIEELSWEILSTTKVNEGLNESKAVLKALEFLRKRSI